MPQDDDNDPEMSEMEQVFGEEIAAQVYSDHISFLFDTS